MALRVLVSRIVSSPRYLPSRVVVQRQGNADNLSSFSTHVEVLPPDREPYLVWGHYDMSIGKAEEDFLKQLAVLDRM